MGRWKTLRFNFDHWWCDHSSRDCTLRPCTQWGEIIFRLLVAAGSLISFSLLPCLAVIYFTWFQSLCHLRTALGSSWCCPSIDKNALGLLLCIKAAALYHLCCCVRFCIIIVRFWTQEKECHLRKDVTPLFKAISESRRRIGWKPDLFDQARKCKALWNANHTQHASTPCYATLGSLCKFSRF